MAVAYCEDYVTNSLHVESGLSVWRGLLLFYQVMSTMFSPFNTLVAASSTKTKIERLLLATLHLYLFTTTSSIVAKSPLSSV